MVPRPFHKWLTNQDHASLEKVVQEISEREEWDTTRTKATGDGGYDLILDRSRSKKIVEIVNRNRVGPGEIREIAGAASEHDIPETAVVAVSFTRGALKAADSIERNSDLVIDLWDEQCLYDKVVSLSVRDIIADF